MNYSLLKPILKLTEGVDMSLNTLPKSVRIFEVGPRDGLQNESQAIDTSVKVELINRLNKTGLSSIEAGSFVSPKWVPQMASSGDVFRQLERQPGVSYAGLTPNLKGLEAALDAGVNESVRRQSRFPRKTLIAVLPRASSDLRLSLKPH